MKRLEKISLWTAVALLVIGLTTWAQGLTADQILEQVEEKSFIGTEKGSIVGTIKLDITEEGETLSYTFKVFGKQGRGGEPDKFLMVYLEPELVAGTMFLAWSPEEGDMRMWLYLPALGIVKELVGESRKQEFVSGSGITYEDISKGFRFREDYNAELLGEEEINGIACYVLVLTPKEGKEVNYSKVVLWVDEEYFNVMKMEAYKDGELSNLMVGSDLREDELGYIPHRYEFQDFEENKSSVIVILERRAAEIPDDYFDPEKLPTIQIEGL
ncbi:outer membrane lipoprotein-sorting protein [Candidatus Bipolaricaulota sp. J31]